MNDVIRRVFARGPLVGVLVAIVLVSGPRMKYFPLYELVSVYTGGFKIPLAVSTVSVIIGLAVLLLFSDLRVVRFDVYLLLPVLLLFGWYVFQFLRGFVNGYESILVVGDFSKILALIVMFLLVGMLDSSETERSLKFFALFGTFGIIIQFMLFLLSGAIEFYFWTVILIPTFLFGDISGVSAKLRNGILLLLTTIVVIGGMRTQWFGLAVILAFYFFVVSVNRDRRHISWQGLTAGLVTLFALVVILPRFGSHIYFELENLVTGGQSVRARIVEYRTVLEYITRRSAENASTLLFGSGLGATYPVSPELAAIRDILADNHHFIHNAFLAVLFRTGLVGIVLFFMVLFRATKASYVNWSSNVAAIWTTLLLLVTVSTVSPLMKTFPYAVITGYILGCTNNLTRGT